MLNALIDALEGQLLACRCAKTKEERRLVAERAFGAVQYHIFLYPSAQDKAGNLWEAYRLRFEKIISESST